MVKVLRDTNMANPNLACDTDICMNLLRRHIKTALLIKLRLNVPRNVLSADDDMIQMMLA